MSDDPLTILVTCVDWTTENPLKGFDAFKSPLLLRNTKSVPVITIFGKSLIGEKVCAHIHGYHPYFYLEIDHDVDPQSPLSASDVFFLRKVSQGIEVALKRLLNIEGVLRVVHDVSFAKGLAFYGYHSEPQNFLKVQLYDPSMVKKIVHAMEEGLADDLMPKGVKMPPQTLESHISYLLSFFIDRDVSGMGLMRINTSTQRSNEEKISCSSLEVDCCVDDVHGITSKDKDLKIKSLSYIWEDERKRRKERGFGVLSNNAVTPKRKVRPDHHMFRLNEQMRKSLKMLIGNETPPQMSQTLSVQMNRIDELEDSNDAEDIELSQMAFERSFHSKGDKEGLDDDWDIDGQSEIPVEDIRASLTKQSCSDHVEDIEEMKTLAQWPFYPSDALEKEKVFNGVGGRVVLEPSFPPPKLNDVVSKRCSQKIEKEAHLDNYGRLVGSADSDLLKASNGGLDVLVIEIHACCSDRLPDPVRDAVLWIRCIVWQDSVAHVMLDLDDFKDELEMYEAFLEFFFEVDPDVIVSYELEKSSIGYISDRFMVLTGERFRPLLSRKHSARTQMDIHGRIVVNLWSVIRSEAKLSSYSIQSSAKSILDTTFPLFTDITLNQWIDSGRSGDAKRYLSRKIQITFDLLKALNLLQKTSELARLFGIRFQDVLERGSQFRVEAMMARQTRSQGFIMLSPTPKQVHFQDATEALPLVMEPRSSLYVDPVIVLDFQSLYPSIMIAYNMCFSTCLGKLVPTDKRGLKKFGAYELRVPEGLLSELSDYIWISPNGSMFVKSEHREGVVPRLLEEILETRVMVKSSMKMYKSDPVLHKMLDSRQFGLKMISNVTYGYTSAGFSGRMPCADIADAIVQTGRETLERAIADVESNPLWKAKVVYGDTDSLFIHLPGRTKEEAFVIAQEIVNHVTSTNPKPVKLKFEKIYQPCVLVSKKRYVGYAYTSVGQEKPIFDDKGLETVRRDGCPLLVQTMEQTIRLLFKKDLGKLRKYLERIWSRVISQSLPLKMFVFSKKVRLGTYRGESLPPAAIVAQKRIQNDPRDFPLQKQRVPYVVVYGNPGARLIDLVIHPLDFVDNLGKYHINALYYIEKQLIPSISRITVLAGIDIQKWFTTMARPKPPIALLAKHQKFTIDQYYVSTRCILCKSLCQSSALKYCNECIENPMERVIGTIRKVRKVELRSMQCEMICRKCCGNTNPSDCKSTDCALMYQKKLWEIKLSDLKSQAYDI